jgi:hypothetical protein
MPCGGNLCAYIACTLAYIAGCECVGMMRSLLGDITSNCYFVPPSISRHGNVLCTTMSVASQCMCMFHDSGIPTVLSLCTGSPKSPVPVEQLQASTQQAVASVPSNPASLYSSPSTSPALPLRLKGEPDRYGIRHTDSICTFNVTEIFMRHGQTDGIVLLEFFGGLAAGLGMVLHISL